MALPYHRIGRIALVCGLQVCAVSAQHPTDKGLQIRVPWITLQRDIHGGYPQINLEAQLSTVIHR
jgi:hypothetical protein